MEPVIIHNNILHQPNTFKQFYLPVTLLIEQTEYQQVVGKDENKKLY